jgi:hypothetical protein
MSTSSLRACEERRVEDSRMSVVGEATERNQRKMIERVKQEVVVGFINLPVS